ncbi:MAG: Uma2 family endonuclease [Nitrospira sp.]|nr:Uma2 family endonuclease [Nitrospira sp.]MDH4303043.1 Uma2 family endonuclease [Nitrospira sp.]MDH5192082.1 Uma2 family endonuclease [Nitrospira sp.]
MSLPRSVRFNYDDFLLFPEDGKRHEIIDGDHFMTPSPNTKHQRISGNLFNALTNFLKVRKNGEVFAAPYDVILSDEDIVEPDLLFVSAARAAIITEKNIQGPPDLVVEILSAGTRKTDEVVKRKLYERYGVREYWIVDPELETIKIHRLTDQGYVRAPELTHEAHDSLSSPLLPGFQMPLTDLFT